MYEIHEALNWLFGVGTEVKEVAGWKVGLRALLIYLSGLAIIRIGQHRFLGKNSAFDAIFAIIIGSVLSRAINGESTISGSLIAAAALVGLHWILSIASFRSHVIGDLIKGKTIKLVAQGKLLKEKIAENNITENDLCEAARLHADINTIEEIEEATLERNGEISIIAKKETQILEIKVENGVQIVRIEINS